MKEITASGRTVEEAIQSSLEQLKTTRDHVEIEIIDEGKKGVLGLFGSKLAVVKVKIIEDPIETAEHFLKNIIDKLDVQINIETTVTGRNVTFDLSGENVAILIGKRGKTLNAVQYLVQQLMNKYRNAYTVTLDADGFRSRRKETLEALAVRTANKVKRLQSPVTLDPMPSFERKVIHHALQDDEQVDTYSDGAEPTRSVVIRTKLAEDI